LRAELDEVIAAWAAARTLDECRAAAEAAELGHARLNTPTDVLTHPQLTERDRWQEVGTPAGPVMALLPPPQVPGWDWRLDPVPGLGEHTEPVLRELGYGDAEVNAMRAAGAI
jgi:itaconate CoA-transferase